MNVYFCALRLDGRPISKRELFAPLSRLPKQVEWESCGEGAFQGVAMARKRAVRPLIAEYKGMIGFGDVRLDNRDDVIANTGHDVGGSDLVVVLAALDRHGPEAVKKFYGDFSFVAWDPRARKVIAGRDCFGIKPLFYRRTNEHLLISSRLEPLSTDAEIDREYAEIFLSGFQRYTSRTIWKDAQQIEPGALLVQRGSVGTPTRYWTAMDFEPADSCNELEAVDGFREAFFESVIQRVEPNHTWAQLSGGVDSSAIVSAASWMHQHGANTALLGAATVTDGLGTGDERVFSDSVVNKYGLRNELVSDYWPWRNDDGSIPRATDEPSPLFPFYAREQRMVDVVGKQAGRVLLSGMGADHYMVGSLTYMADMFARGRVKDGAREVLAWAVQTRRSFWHTARRNVLDPIVHARGNRLGSHFIADTTHRLLGVSNWIQRDVFQDRLEVRYPFLARKLVEYTLRLPVNMKVRPGSQKYILRESMRGILPEDVRTRTHKGGIDARILWSFQHEHALIEAMLSDPIVSQYGLMDADRLRLIVEQARQGDTTNTIHVMSALALESWLRARNDAWPSHVMSTRTAA